MKRETLQRENAPASVIFVIEDDDVQRRGLARFLTREGFEVREFADGESAADSLCGGSRLPDVVICDYRLPGQNGLEVASSLREVVPRARFILISAYLNGSIRREAGMRGVSAVLEKPFGMDQLFRECRTPSSGR